MKEENLPMMIKKFIIIQPSTYDTGSSLIKLIVVRYNK